MKKFFNITGPCIPEEHYMLSVDKKCEELQELIDQKQYFILHAARQSGKTTLLLELVRQLNASGKYYALYCSLESVQNIPEMEKGIPAVLQAIRSSMKWKKDLPSQDFPIDSNLQIYSTAVKDGLAEYCSELNKPLVILFDEADCLSNGTLVSFLRQLRDGFINRSQIPFVHSVGLIGMRNIRDYKAKIREESQTLGSASPFNIIKKVTRISNFTKEETNSLLSQHTEQTGQKFSSTVIEKTFFYSKGQPWLVNAISCEIIEEILQSDSSQEITAAHVEQAVQAIILRRDTHIDSLMERLKEKRVQKVMEPVILGENKGFEALDDDYQYVQDLGLLCLSEKRLIPSNPIYGEVIFRVLTHRSQMELEQKEYPPSLPAYIVDNKIDMKQLLGEFQQFWRKNSEIWVEKYEYKEAAPHLILQAFLQKFMNSGGRISREMALGLGRLDLCLHYEEKDYPIELKIRYEELTYAEGKTQLEGYMDKLGCQEGWLVVFDRDPDTPWEEKIFWRTESLKDNKTIHIVGG